MEKIYCNNPKTIPFKFEHCYKNENIDVCNDALEAIERLSKGEIVARFEYGDSMLPLLESGEYAVLVPNQKIEVGDAVFCNVNGYIMTHMVMMISNVRGKPMYLIGSPNYNSNGTFNIYGWTSEIYAKAYKTNVFEKESEYSY